MTSALSAPSRDTQCPLHNSLIHQTPTSNRQIIRHVTDPHPLKFQRLRSHPKAAEIPSTSALSAALKSPANSLLDPATEMKGAEIEDERATEVARRKMDDEMKALKGKGVDNVVEAEEESEDDEGEVKDGGGEGDEEEDADEEEEEEETQSGALDEEDEDEDEDDEDEDSEDDDDDHSSDGEEDMGTEYLVQPVGRAEDEEDASDFEPDDEDSEDEDIEDEEDFESGSAGKVEASMKRKRSSDDGNDDTASGDDDEKPAKR